MALSVHNLAKVFPVPAEGTVVATYRGVKASIHPRDEYSIFMSFSDSKYSMILWLWKPTKGMVKTTVALATAALHSKDKMTALANTLNSSKLPSVLVYVHQGNVAMHTTHPIYYQPAAHNIFFNLIVNNYMHVGHSTSNDIYWTDVFRSYHAHKILSDLQVLQLVLSSGKTHVPLNQKDKCIKRPSKCIESNNVNDVD